MLYPLLIVAGLGLVGWGLPAAHRLKKPLDIVASLAVLAGVVVAILGVLLTAVPAFFEG